MVLKIPPPPQLSRDFQQLNRWLLEVQSILNEGGTIDPDLIAGLPALFLQVAANTANIAANAAAIAAANAAIATNTANIAANTVSINLLIARNQIRNGNGVPAPALGNNGDLYIDNLLGPPVLYGKVAGVWVAFI